jgi:hypothetical protein
MECDHYVMHQDRRSNASNGGRGSMIGLLRCVLPFLLVASQPGR